MFKKIIKITSKEVGKSTLRFRHSRPNCPLPSDYSKVEKVTICGAGNPLGQYLAFMLKRAALIKELALYDEGNVRGLALDLEHLNTKVKVRPNSGNYSIKNAIRHSDIVIITNGFEAALDEDEDKSLRENASIIYKYGVKIASCCPDALVCIATPPINVMVPLFSEVMKVCNAYDPNKIFGVCSLAEMRANSIIADYLSLDPAAVKVPIVGGTTPTSLVPLLSHAKPYNEFSNAEMQKLISTILEVPEECRKLKTTAPMSTAYALARFVLTLAAGLCTCNCAIQTAFVRSNVIPQVKYFASSIRTTLRGTIANYGLPKIHEYELELLSMALATIDRDCEKARTLFNELHLEARKEEIEEFCRPNKPFIIKTPCPPCPPCFPTDVCQEKLPEDPCAPAKPDSVPYVCRCYPE